MDGPGENFPCIFALFSGKVEFFRAEAVGG
jgi:hypothetical protein